MGIRGITFANQTMTPVAFGVISEAQLSDGIIKGCAVTFNGVNVTVADGYFVMAGRVIQIVGNETITTSPSHANGYGRIKARINLNEASTATEFSQVSFVVDYSETDSWSALTREDINESGIVCEVEFAVVKYTSSVVDSVIRTMGKASGGFGEYIHTKNGTVHELTGGGDNVKFVATASFEDGDTFTVNGAPCIAQTQDGEALSGGYFVSGAVVLCFKNGNTLNFKSGSVGGLNFKVVGGTAQPTNPSENTIWINTEDEITSWAFAAENPWINTVVQEIDGTGGQGGYINDNGGITSSSSSWLCPTAFDVLPNTEYTYSTSKTANYLSVAFFNGNTYISRSDVQNVTSRTFTTPANCTKIRLWIDTAANAAAFNAYNPKLTHTENTAEEGAVWIRTGVKSETAFNAVRKNSITVYPVKVEQSISGAWVNKTAITFTGGQWKSWDTYLYNRGDKHTDLTGGWTFWRSVNNNSCCIAEEADGQIHLFAHHNSGAVEAWARSVARTTDKIDLTDIETLTANATSVNGNGKQLLLGIGTSTPSGQQLAYLTAQAGIAAAGTVSLDVSSFTGEYYVYVVASPSGSWGYNTDCLIDAVYAS